MIVRRGITRTVVLTRRYAIKEGCMATVTWLADVLRAAGLTVVEHTGWKTHARPGDWNPKFVVVHATAAPRSQPDETQVRIVRDGRADLRGPIGNACIDRQGRWHVLSAGRCNTTLAGTSGPFKGLGNTNALGIEACNDNGLASPAERWPDVQYRSYVVGVAAICRRLGWPASHVVGHREHTPGHKTDPTFSMTTFRTDVSSVLAGKEDDMNLSDKLGDSGPTVGVALQSGYQRAGKAADNSAAALAKLDTLAAKLDQVAAKVATPPQVDVHALAAALDPLLDGVSVTPEVVEQAFRNAFARP